MPACSTAPHPPLHSVPLATLHLGEHNYRIVDLPAAAGADYARLPWVLRLLLENVLRTSADAPSTAAGPGEVGEHCLRGAAPSCAAARPCE